MQSGSELVSPLGNRYPIRDGIPRFVADVDAGQAQTAESFGYKWTRHANWGQREADGTQGVDLADAADEFRIH